MSRSFFILFALALLFAPFVGCDDPADDDDEVVPPGDDDDATPDDGTPRLSFEPGLVQAGQIAVVFTTLHNFVLEQGATVCCASDDVVFLGTDEMINEELYDFVLFFGVLGEGTATWGIESGGEQAVGEFEIEPIGEIPELAPGLGGGSGLIDTPDGFDVFSFEVLEGNSLVTVRASTMGSPDLHPWLWVLAEDGRTALRSAGFETANGYATPAAGLWVEEPGVYYLRVADNDEGASGDDFTYDVDLQISPAGEPMPHSEVEPNDDSADWQDAGVFGAGIHQLGGMAATAGHDADNDLSGDLDVFLFELEEDSVVEFQLDWEGDDDMDALLYMGDRDEVTLGFGSSEAISYRMASANKPETTVLTLPAGETFVAEVGNWDGDPEARWTLDMRVIPLAIEE